MYEKLGNFQGLLTFSSRVLCGFRSVVTLEELMTS